MNSELLSVPRLTDVSPDDIARYLTHLGWRRVPFSNPSYSMFAGPTESTWQRIELILPRTQELGDSDIRLADLIRSLARMYRQPIEFIVNQIRNRDTLKVVISGPSSSSVRAHDFIHLVRALCDLLGYAGILEDDTRPYFWRKPQRLNQVIQGLEVGPLMSGSFGLLLEVPLPGLAPVGNPEAPVLRRAAIRLMRGLRSLQELAESDDAATFAESTATGFNGNMYRIMADLQEVLVEREFVYSPSWSPYWPVPADVQQLQNVRVPPQDHDLLITAAKELAQSESHMLAVSTADSVRQIEGPSEIVGIVTHLHSERLGGGSNHEIVVKEIETGRRVHIEMDLDQYRVACDAHRDQRQIAVSGRLKRSRGVWVLTEVHGFAVH